MKRAGWLGLCFFIVTACGRDANEGLFKTYGGNGGQGGNRKTDSEKPLPALSGVDGRLTVLDELSRIDRSVEFLTVLPFKKNPEGCLDFTSKPGTPRFLVVRFDRCLYETPAPDEKTRLQFKLQGQEVFVDGTRNGRGSREARANLNVTITRLSTPPKLALRAPYSRRVNLALPTSESDSGTAAVDAEVTRGVRAELETDFWSVRLKDSAWSVEGTRSIEKGTLIDFLYRAAGVSSVMKLEMEAETAITFGKCRRPYGEFSWRASAGTQDSTSGRVRADANGITEVESGTRHAWPQNCLENK